MSIKEDLNVYFDFGKSCCDYNLKSYCTDFSTIDQKAVGADLFRICIIDLNLTHFRQYQFYIFGFRKLTFS